MTVAGKSVPHDSAIGHVTGTAHFIEDLEPLQNELRIDFVGAPCASGRLLGIDAEAASRIPGVAALFTHRDVDGRNHFGPVVHDEPFLVEDTISYIGQPVVVIAADSVEAARQARLAVRLEVEEIIPVLTIGDALDRQDLLGPIRHIRRGDFDTAYGNAARRIEGIFRSNGQDHFYLESQAALAVPGEGGQITVHSSTQNPTETQAVMAEVLGLDQHQIVCQCKRMGGAFGGKETQAVIPALMTGLVAQKTGRAARVIYSKDDDMRVTGKRHPYETRYRIGFDTEGRIVAAGLDFVSNGGAFVDLSLAVLERTLMHADNAYYLPNVHITGRVCRTNLPPNTAFRGFGGPQAVAVIENALQEMSLHLGVDAYDLRRLNCYSPDLESERSVTPYGQRVRDNHLPDIFERLASSSSYRERMTAVETFNGESRTHLRGLAMTAVKFGISFTNRSLNQANALVNVYTDGTVQVSTGATEMGQGVNTKIRQLVADELGVGYEDVLVMVTSTEKNNNTSPTAASASTDLNGTAAVRACQAIRERLADLAAARFADPEQGLVGSPEHVCFAQGVVFDQRSPELRLPFSELCKLAHRERVDLGARGFYATPGIDFNRDTGKGNPFFYFTTGSAVAEVLIDRLTGDLHIERVDLLMDIGRMVNPGVDRGQVIGGLIQGIGWVTSEEILYSKRGELLSLSPTTYKIPNITDLPSALGVEFLDNGANSHNIFHSKAVGEPPFMLGISVWAAVKHALSFVREGAVPDLALPATAEEILMTITRLADGVGEDKTALPIGQPAEP